MVTAINPFPIPVPAGLDYRKQGIVSLSRARWALARPGSKATRYDAES